MIDVIIFDIVWNESIPRGLYPFPSQNIFHEGNQENKTSRQISIEQQQLLYWLLPLALFNVANHFMALLFLSSSLWFLHISLLYFYCFPRQNTPKQMYSNGYSYIERKKQKTITHNQSWIHFDLFILFLEMLYF